ncbi:rhodanese-like domain-containing protein [Herbiconiux ginsengi]|uniref:Rhodanese-related sulfurtransferase n=1 Tax=Herbiconiux ginsengi TaxID=381665 RepID=A0A1H3S2Y8_9MICO|nr:rhodanese-like domain-containing protein [Herbiconiux ginsengi]SDZ31945.1 Rhodanese-related sulfurtransferase [Herbiconiux ginsengi]
MNSTTVTALSTENAPIVIDVREADEYAGGHVPGGVNIPLSQLADRLDAVPRHSTVFVICQSGGRSARATDFLTGQGIDAINVEGGTGAWISAGLPVERA